MFNSIRTLTTTVNTLSGCRLTSRKAVVYDHWWSILAYFQSQSFTTYTHAGRGERALAQGPNMSHIIKHVHRFPQNLQQNFIVTSSQPNQPEASTHVVTLSFMYDSQKIKHYCFTLPSHTLLNRQNTQLDLSIRCF